jgi:hypothetical protein
MGVRLGIIYTSQSNGLYPNRGEAGSALTGCGYFGYSDGTSDGTGGLMVDAPGKGTGQGGSMYTILRILSQQYGIPCDGIDLTAGSSAYNEWMPLESGAGEGRACIVQLRVALAALKARHPGDTFIFLHIRNQGTTDARVANAQYQSGAGYPGATYPGWALGFRGLARVSGAAASWHDAVEDEVTAVYKYVSLIHYIVVESNRSMTLQTFPYTIQDQQALAVTNVSGGRVARLLQLRDDAGYDVADQVHHIAAACTITVGVLPGVYSGGGFHWKGTAEASLAKEIWEQLMGNVAVTAKNAALNNKRNKGTYSPPASHWFAAYVAGVRKGAKSLTNNTTLWPNASGRTKTNGIEIAWDAATGSDWGAVDEIRIFDADPAGASNELGRCTLSSAVTIAVGEILRIAPAAIQLVLPAGCLTDAEARASLDLLFGGTAETPRTTTYLSYFLGNPASGGTILGSSVALTQASVWGVASGGVMVSAADISLAQQLTATYMAEHTAASGGGSLISSFTVETPPGSGTITAGRLQTTIP